MRKIDVSIGLIKQDKGKGIQHGALTCPVLPQNEGCLLIVELNFREGVTRAEEVLPLYGLECNHDVGCSSIQPVQRKSSHLFQGSFVDTHFHSGTPTTAPATNMRTLHQIVPRIWSMFALLSRGI